MTRLVGAILLEQNDRRAVQRAPLNDPGDDRPPPRSRPPNSYTTPGDTTLQDYNGESGLMAAASREGAKVTELDWES